MGKKGTREMNANELDKWIENSPYTEQEEVIVLLRQQQAKIEALEILVDELAGYKASYENGIRMEDGYGFN